MDVEPQSIIHQVIRLERTVICMVKRTITSGSMSSRRRKPRNSSIAKDSGHSNASTLCSSCDESGVVSKDDSDDEPSFHKSGDGPSVSESSREESPVFDKEIKDLTVSVPETHYSDYRTINQNEFFIECMINGEGTPVLSLFTPSTKKMTFVGRWMHFWRKRQRSLQRASFSGSIVPGHSLFPQS